METLWYRKLCMKTCMIFLTQNVSITPDHNVLVLFVSNIYIGNSGTVWHRKLCIKTSKVKNLCEFHRFFWAPKYFNTPILYTTHAILELVNSISNSFENGKFTLGNFIDFSKALDMVGHAILLNKHDQYGIKKYYEWFKCYLFRNY